jgi:hypothetical protein
MVERHKSPSTENEERCLLWCQQNAANVTLGGGSLKARRQHLEMCLETGLQ